jgi:integrase
MAKRLKMANTAMGTSNEVKLRDRDFNSDRLHLTGREVERLLEATRSARNDTRDRCLVLITFRHGFRVWEACRLKLDQVDTESRVLHVMRLKHGLSTTHPLRPSFTGRSN